MNRASALALASIILSLVTAGFVARLWFSPEQSAPKATYFLILVKEPKGTTTNAYFVETHQWSTAATAADRGDKIVRFVPSDGLDRVEVKMADIQAVRRLP